jgi:hypothetical protein
MPARTVTATTTMSNNDFESDTLCITASDIPPNDGMPFDLIALPDLGPILSVDHDLELDVEMVDISRHTIRDTSNMDATIIMDDTMPSQRHHPMHPAALVHGVGGLMINSLVLVARGIMWVPQACQRALPGLATSTNSDHRRHPARSHTVPPLANAQYTEDGLKDQDSAYASDSDTITSESDEHDKPSFILAYWNRQSQQQHESQTTVSDPIELKPIS